MCLFVHQFPFDLLVWFWSEWTDIPDLACLDSALCSKTVRDSFLEIISSRTFVHASLFSNKRSDYYSWIIQRNLRVKCFDFSAFKYQSSHFVPLPLPLPPMFLEYFQQVQEVNHMIFGYSVEWSNLLSRRIVNSLDLSPSREFLTNSELIEILEKCGKSLLKLSVNKCSALDDSVGPHVAKLCPNLTSFESFHTNLTGSFYDVLSSGCPNLTTIKSGCETTDGMFTDELIVNIAIRCPKMKHFQMQCNEGITNQSLFTIAENYPLLEFFDISVCPNIDDSGIIRIFTNCSRLNYLDLSGVKITDNSLKYLKLCPDLHTIKLIDCTEITDAGMHEALANCSKLTCVDLYGCSSLTDVTIFNLIKFCKELQEIYVGGDALFTDFALSELAEKCPKLHLFSCESFDMPFGVVYRAMRNAKCLVFDDTGGDDDDTCKTIVIDRSITRTRKHPIVTFNTCLDGEILSKYLPTIAYVAPELQSVTFRNYGCDDNAIGDFLQRYEHLTSICMKNMKYLSDETIEKILRKTGANLTSLTLNRCEYLSRASIDSIAKLARNITNLDLSHNEFYSTDDTDSLIEMIENCDCLKSLKIVGNFSNFQPENCPQIYVQVDPIVGEDEDIAIFPLPQW